MLVISYTLIDSTLSPSLAHPPSTHLLIVRPGSCQRLLHELLHLWKVVLVHDQHAVKVVEMSKAQYRNMR